VNRWTTESGTCAAELKLPRRSRAACCCCVHVHCYCHLGHLCVCCVFAPGHNRRYYVYHDGCLGYVCRICLLDPCRPHFCDEQGPLVLPSMRAAIIQHVICCSLCVIIIIQDTPLIAQLCWSGCPLQSLDTANARYDFWKQSYTSLVRL
jgi:hypothetical protein